MIKNLIMECDFEIVNLSYKKIHDIVLNKYCIFKDQTRVLIFTSYQISIDGDIRLTIDPPLPQTLRAISMPSCQ